MMSGHCPKCGNYMPENICEICADNFNYEVAEELRKENQQLKQRELELMAQVDALRNLVLDYKSELLEAKSILIDSGRLLNMTATEQNIRLREFDLKIRRLDHTLSHTENGSLNNVKADAVAGFMKHMDADGPWQHRDEAEAYANQLRQQADKG